MLHGRRSKSSMLLSTISTNFNICLGIKDLINAYPLGECVVYSSLMLIPSYLQDIDLLAAPFGNTWRSLWQHLATSTSALDNLSIWLPQHQGSTHPPGCVVISAKRASRLGIDASTGLVACTQPLLSRFGCWSQLRLVYVFYCLIGFLCDLEGVKYQSS